MEIAYAHSDAAPRTYGPYSQAVITEHLVFTSGQLPIDPLTMQVKGASIGEQATCVLNNLRAVLVAAGTDVHRVVKTTLYLVDLDDFEEFNAVYASVFGPHRPARSTVQVASLPRGVRVEVDAIALR